MTGDEIRAAEFPLRSWGYDSRLVREELSLIADLREYGFAPERYSPRGGRYLGLGNRYDREAVDRFFAALASQAPPGLVTLPAVPDAPSKPRECEAAYHRFGLLPGVRLYVRFTGMQPREVASSQGEILLTLPLGSGVPALSICHRRFSRGYGRDQGYVLFPGRRCLVFSVAGRRATNTLMTAVTESGSTALWFRKRHGPDCDVVVSPDYELSRELLCAVAVAAVWLAIYLDREGRGEWG